MSTFSDYFLLLSLLITHSSLRKPPFQGDVSESQTSAVFWHILSFSAPPHISVLLRAPGSMNRGACTSVKFRSVLSELRKNIPLFFLGRLCSSCLWKKCFAPLKNWDRGKMSKALYKTHQKNLFLLQTSFRMKIKKSRYRLYPIIGQYWPLFLHRDDGASSLPKTHKCEQQY